MREIWIPSPNYSTSRGPYNKIVLHTTEGAMTVESLGSWFANPSAGCSSHHGADNVKPDTLGAYVYENHKAWTQGNANDYCLSLEMCAYASWSRDKWLNEQGVLLRNAASWVAWMSSKYGIPLRVLSNSEAQNPSVRGVCQHVNFGSWGSGHHDCGDGFPIDIVMQWAAGSAPPVSPPEEEDEGMFAVVIPPGAGVADSPDVGVSLDKTSYRAIGFCADAGRLAGSVVKVRVAWHLTNNTWTVQNITLDGNKNKVVANLPAGQTADGVSFRRGDDVPITLYPNFG